MMLNMDPTMHTRYRRLVNHGFTPKMVRDLEQQIVGYADGIIDAVCERGTADFVVEMAAELPLLVIAELLGVPQEDRRMVFDWSNRMIGSDDPEYQIPGTEPGEAAMQVYAYAEELANSRRLEPRTDLISVLIDAEVEGEKLDQLELDLFFMLLIVAGNETTRNLMSGAMTAFFDHPEQWEKLRQDRSLLPNAVEEMLRYVTPVMHFRRTATTDLEMRGQQIREGDKVVFWHTSANRDELVFDEPEHVRRHPVAEPPHRVRRRRPPLLPGSEPGPDGDHGAVRPPPRPDSRHPARRRSPTPAVQLHQRHQAHPGGLRTLRTRRGHAASRPGPLRWSPWATAECGSISRSPSCRPARSCRWRSSATSWVTAACTSRTTSSTLAGASRATPIRSSEDGAPGWEDDTAWPDPMCVVSALAGSTTNLVFTTGIYIAPARDILTVAKTVSTAAVLSDDRLRLGVGVGWSKEEFDLTGQDFANRGKRLDEMIVALRALWRGGWVEFHGEFYDVPECQMEPSPSAPVPILGGGHSPVALRRTAALCDGWIAAGAYSEDEAWAHLDELRDALKASGPQGR